MPAYHSRLQMYGDLICSFILQVKPVRLLTGMPGNTGDRLNWRGGERLLSSHGVEPTPLPFPEARVLEDKWRGGTLVIPDNAAYTASWHEWMPELTSRVAPTVERVVILPSSDDPSVPVVAEALSRPNVFAFTREAASFHRIKARTKACLGDPTPALYALDPVAPPADTAGGGTSDSVLVALRTDRDSTLREHGVSPLDGVNDDISATVEDLDEFPRSVSETSPGS